jgi:uncharacterized membrane protein
MDPITYLTDPTTWQSLIEVLRQIFAWVMSANPLALILVGAVVAFVGKRVIEAVGLLILIYGVIRLVAPLIGVHLPF